MNRDRLERVGAAAVFLLCAAMTAYYLIAGYGAYLDADMSSELALAQHLVKEGTLISPTWMYSTEVRVLSTQLIFAPLMAIFPHNWRLVRTLGCLILLAMQAGSAYFCARALGAKRRDALLFSGLTISACSVVYSQMILIGAYYVPHAVLTNLCVGMTARAYAMERGKRRAALCALLLALCALMGASSIRYPFCATLPVAAAGVWAYLFPAGDERLPRTRAQTGRCALAVGVALVSLIGFAAGQRILGAVCQYDAARYGGSRLAAFTSADLPAVVQDAIGGLVRLMGYRERSILLSVHGLVSVGAVLLPVLAALLCVRTLRRARHERTILRFGVLALLMSAALTAGTFVLVENLYMNRYWIPLLTLGAPVMAACLSHEDNRPLRTLALLAFAGVVVCSSAMEIRTSMAKPQIVEADRQRVEYLRENGLDFGYAPFWNANVVTELSDGDIEVVNVSIVEREGAGAVAVPTGWLEAAQNVTLCRPEEPVFMLLTQGDAQKLRGFLDACGAEKTAGHGALDVWVIPTQRAFFDAVQPPV